MLDRRQFIASLPLISGAARALAVGLPVEELAKPRPFGGAIGSNQPQGVRVRFNAFHITLYCRALDYRQDVQQLYDAYSELVSYTVGPAASLTLTDVTMQQADVDDLVSQLHDGSHTTAVTIDMADTAEPGDYRPLLGWPDVRVRVDNVRLAGGLDWNAPRPKTVVTRYAEIKLLLRHPPLVVAPAGAAAISRAAPHPDRTRAPRRAPRETPSR
jgi:hypothetical protein